MNVFMTNGTYHFLKKITDKFPKIDFYFMSSGTSTLAYYEGSKKNVFSAGRSYQSIISEGTVEKEGYVVMNNIPITDEGEPIFEDRFEQRINDIKLLPGFQAFRLLRPTKGETYIVFTQWASKKDFEAWKQSVEFKKSHQDQSIKPPAYSADQPFVISYTMIDEEEI